MGKYTERGYGDASYKAGIMYEKGRGVLQDIDEALKHYEKAAKKKNWHALVRLANIYERGDLVKRDLQLAFDYCSKAVELRGNIEGDIKSDDISCIIRIGEHGYEPAVQWCSKNIMHPYHSEKQYENSEGNNLGLNMIEVTYDDINRIGKYGKKADTNYHRGGIISKRRKRK